MFNSHAERKVIRHLFCLLLLVALTTISCTRDQSVIVFSSNLDGDFEIYSVSPYNGNGEIRQLTDNEDNDRYPSLAGNGTIAFISDKHGKDDIYTTDFTGGDIIRLTTEGTNRYPTFSPDGRHILFISDRDGDFQIFRMDADGTHQVKITENAFEDRSPSYSPDGKKIVFSSSRVENYDIYIMNADGSFPTRLFSRGDSWAPRFSPDGKQIVFYSDASGDFEIYVMNADGSKPRQLTFDNGAVYPCFSPDGRYIVYSRYIDDLPQIYTYRVSDGHLSRLLKSTAMDMTPRWAKIMLP